MATNSGNSEQLDLPRGVRVFEEEQRALPFAVQWRVEGKRKTKFFPTLEKRNKFALGLAKDVERVGVAAYRLDESEARQWRAFIAQLDGATLDDVLRCWRRYGKAAVAQSVADAIAGYSAAKKAEGVSSAALAHYRVILDRFSEAFGKRDVRTIEREEIAEWLDGFKHMAEESRRSIFKRVQSLFSWLRVSRMIPENPCDGLRPVKVTPSEVSILSVSDAAALFVANKRDRDGNTTQKMRELCGRMALEAFVGLRFDTARQVVASEIVFDQHGLALPAEKLKTRRPQFIDGLPANVWAWLEWSKPKEWAMTPRDYMREKSLAFVRARVVNPGNVLRHSFATYHVAAHKDVSKTATILCHTSPKMLFAHYRGRATEADGKAYFEIVP